VFDRLACDDLGAGRAVLDRLKVDGVSRFVRETEAGPLFEYIPAAVSELMDLIKRVRLPDSVTLIVSGLSEAETASRIDEAKRILRRRNLTMEPSPRN
jgi:hypothetical protein